MHEVKTDCQPHNAVMHSFRNVHQSLRRRLELKARTRDMSSLASSLPFAGR